MAHLNLVMIHPFRDGNGRMARALATLVLTRSDIGEPEFSSIEEWLGANTEDYYSVLAHTGRLFSLWLNNPLDAAVEHSTDEFAGTFRAQETRDQIAHHYRRITGRSS